MARGRKRLMDSAQVEIAKAMYVTDRLTLDKIGERLNCSAVTVSKELRRAGVPVRKPGRPSKAFVPTAPTKVEKETFVLPLPIPRTW